MTQPVKDEDRPDLRAPRGRITLTRRCRIAIAILLSALILVIGSMLKAVLPLAY